MKGRGIAPRAREDLHILVADETKNSQRIKTVKLLEQAILIMLEQWRKSVPYADSRRNFVFVKR